jgi:hypothetical protein
MKSKSDGLAFKLIPVWLGGLRVMDLSLIVNGEHAHWFNLFIFLSNIAN